MQRVLLIICFLILSLIAPLAARGADFQQAFSPELRAYLKLSNQTRVYLLGDLTRNFTENKTDGEIGAHLDVTLPPLLRRELRDGDWERSRYLWLRVGYLLIGPTDGREHATVEHQGIFEANIRAPLVGAVWLYNRERVDLRNLNGAWSQYGRVKFGFEREFILAGVLLVPYLEAETFYDTRYAAWSRQVYKVGSDIELSPSWRLEPYYEWQVDHVPSSFRMGTVGLMFKFFH
jgi:hypothetical protein